MGFFGTVLFWVNSLAVFLLFLAFFLPYVAPSKSPTLSILSLGVSPLLWLNFLFLVYWLLRRKRVFLLSASALVIAYFIFNPFYKFSSEGDASTTQQTLSVLSYNVRLFNLYEAESKTKEASEVLSEIIKEKDPDIICLQEFIKKHTVDFSAYPFIYTEFKKDNTLGHAIYSKHPIINTGSFNFKETANNTIFADIVHGTDTIRVYNLHLQSIGIKPSVEKLQEEDKQKVRRRISSAFIKQEQQAAIILDHSQRCEYPKIMAGDFNNTPFSYVYRYLSEDMQDAFLERGNGLGTTFNFDFYPMRIDYILTSENFNILSFERIDTTFSDHYPILSNMVIE
ncbi:MAG: endonuclease [Flavobacteriaceae bacterium]|nr:endonuclease [Flavobacteriaceae bacterium]